MKHPQELLKDLQSMRTLAEITDIFESISSIHIAQIKTQVQDSQAFFYELWNMYTQLRVDKDFHFGRAGQNKPQIDKELVIIITSEGGFSGDIDQKLMGLMLARYDANKQDIIIVGHHGAMRLAQSGIYFKKYYRLPSRDKDINVSPIVKEVQQYKSTTVYYQTYVSLMVQDVKRIELSRAVQEEADRAKPTDDVISEKNYIFEPTTYEVIDHLERSMLHIALSQVILESKLAQYASRFQAMSSAHSRAVDSRHDLHIQLNRAKRYVNDERLKEVINGLRKMRTA